MKKVISIAMIALLVFSLTACQQGGKKGEIKIGLFQPLTGNSSYMGIPGKLAAEMAIKHINEAGGVLGKKLVLVPYDDASSPDQALQAVQKMVEVDKVDAILGSLHSGNIQVCGEYLEANKVPLMGTGTSPAWLKQGWTYLFRATLNTYYNSLASINACNTLGLKKLAGFYSLDDYGKNGMNDMEKLCAENKIEIVAKESMTPGDTDLTGQCTNIANAKPEVVYMIATADNLPQMVKQIRANGFVSYIIGEQSLDSPEVKNVAGAAANGLVFGACFTMPKTPEEANTPELQKFFQDYWNEYGVMCPSEVAVRCYDAIYLLAEGFEKAKSTDGEKVRDAIYTINNAERLQGKFDFTQTKNGEGLMSARLFIIQDLKQVLMDDYLKNK